MLNKKVNINNNYILFPFDKVAKNSNIILYGAGDIGKILYEQIYAIKYCNVIAFADRAAKSINFSEYFPRCIVPNDIYKYDYDFIVIAKTNNINFIIDDLIKLQVNYNKIIVLENSNIIDVNLQKFNKYNKNDNNELELLKLSYKNNLSENEIYKYCKEIIIKENIVVEGRNLFEWYPFKKNENILEIGSGFGILTELFCERLNEVISVENCIQKYEINKLRNYNKSNLKLFNNLEQALKYGKFDYIILLDNYNESEIENTILYIKSFLKSNGKLFIANNNKYSMMNWCKNIEGLTYLDKGIKKNELEFLINKIMPEYKCIWYYPVLDYRKPDKIYTDKYLPQLGDIRMNKFIHFNIDIAYDAISITEAYKILATSYLICIQPKLEEKPDLLFINYKRLRKENFRICTMIKEKNNKLIVIKKALNNLSKKHIFSMLEKYNILKNVYINFNFIKVWVSGEDEISFDYIEGESLDNLLFNMRDEPNKVFHLIKDFSDKMYNVNNNYIENFYMTEDFKAIFGDIGQYKGKGIRYGNIDCHFDNIKIKDSEYYCFDYEWVFPFLIPNEYLVFRSIDIFLKKYSNYFHSDIYGEIFLEKLGFDKEKIEIFQKMNINLNKYYSEDDIDRINFTK